MSVDEGALRAALEERLRFERFISDLSARFMRLQPEDVESEVARALEEVRRFYGADRCALLGFSPDQRRLSTVHVAHAPEVPSIPADFDWAERYPWQYRRVVGARSPFNASTVDAFPADAVVDRRSFVASRLKSSLAIPLFVAQDVRYVITLAAVAQQRTWTDTLVQRQSLLGEILVNALERRDSERALRDSQERLLLAVDSADAGLWELDVDSGNIWCTPRGRELAGLPPGEASSLSELEDAMHPDDRERIKESLQRVLTGTSERTHEFRVVWPGGEVHWLALHGRLRSSPLEKRVRLMGVVIDVTERRKSEERQRETLAELERLRDQLQKENVYLRREVKGHGEGRIVGKSDVLRLALAQVEQVASTDSTVLLLGETGTGKELFAAAIHEQSGRRGRTMVRVNCAAMPAPLVESELFGRDKGAFTGALAKQIGRFEMASGSTIFLDEVGDLPMEVQVKLLRVLQEKEIERLGNPRPIKVDVRVIAATNRDLTAAVAQGRFREDLYYRLNVFPITLPPLRARPDDVPLLVQSFVDDFARSMGKTITSIARADVDALARYSWPGNVRQLRNVVERAMILAHGPVLRIEAPDQSLTPAPTARPASAEVTNAARLADVQRRHILGVLEKTGWRIRGENGAANILGLKPTTLETRMAKLGITRPGKRP